jgi:16S rRNA G527 N7-methylase RsmG
MKIRSVGAELFHANGQSDRRTDRQDEANSRFSKFFEPALKKWNTTSNITGISEEITPYTNYANKMWLK